MKLETLNAAITNIKEEREWLYEELSHRPGKLLRDQWQQKASRLYILNNVLRQAMLDREEQVKLQQ